MLSIGPRSPEESSSVNSIKQHEASPWRRAVLARVSALALSIGLLLSNQDTINPHAPVSLRTDATMDYPSLEELWVLEASYPPMQTLERKQPILDATETSEYTDVYRYANLENLSFARPKVEVISKLLYAESIEEIAAGAEGYFESVGIKLHLNPDHPMPNGEMLPLTNDDLLDLRTTVYTIINEIANTPRELIKFANVSDLYFASKLYAPKAIPVAGMAYSRHNDTSFVALTTSTDSVSNRYLWNHELAHAIATSLNKITGNYFAKSFHDVNHPEFIYSNEVLPDGLSELIIKDGVTRQTDSRQTVSEYASSSLDEDFADTYASLLFDEGVPSPNDRSFNTISGLKRVFVMEILDRHIPGLKKYWIGWLSTVEYQNYRTGLVAQRNG